VNQVKEVTGEAAACDNPDCPTEKHDREVLAYHSAYNPVRRKFQVDGKFTLCEACLEELGLALPEEAGA
jgi:hypothetical protein